MSVSVKSISVSINGILSEQFHIEINGSGFTLEGFTLSQTLLHPCRLSFGMQKDTDENAEDVNFKVCQDIIGQNIALVLQTESMEADMEGYEDTGQQNGTIEFKGFIVSANATRTGSDYYISIEALSHDARMQTMPHCYMYNDYQLKDIVKEHLADYEGFLIELEGEVETKRDIHYTVQYNESDYEFMQRLAMRHQEWMFSTGTKLHFGKLEEQESIKLTYPSENLSDYSVDMRTKHQNYMYYTRVYNRNGANSEVNGALFNAHGLATEMNGNQLSDTAYGMSIVDYPKDTITIQPGQQMEADGELKAFMEKGDTSMLQAINSSSIVFRDSMRANLVHYRGRSTCARLKIGTKLTIMDDFISGEGSQKNEVQQDEILITEVYHSFGVNGDYSTSFEGVPATINYPPYMNPRTYPRCDHPVHAIVVDTEDPEHLGRIRVRFNWQHLSYEGKRGKKEKNGMTPWINLAQPYVGSTKDKGGVGGVHLVPEVFSPVMVEFEEGNFERPIAICSFPALEGPIDAAWYPGWNNVKAIRTSSGHTIEIHDTADEHTYGDKGYIKVYDNKKHTYELLLSTDRSLIKLHSVGNIELDAGKDIIMTAGKNISMKAKNETINMEALQQISAISHGTVAVQANDDITAETDKDMKVKAHDNIKMQSKQEAFEIRAKGDIKVESEQSSISIIAYQGIGNKGDETVYIKSSAGIKLHAAENVIAQCDLDDFKVECNNLSLNPKMNMEFYGTQFKMSFSATGNVSFSGPLSVTGMPGKYH